MTATAATAVDRSNSLPDLAARITIEHEATAAALQRGTKHAMNAGDLLLEAKRQVPHGKWRQWCEANCTMSERTIQLYIKLAKGRATIEKEMANPQSVADLTMNEAAALCVLAGRFESLIELARRSQTATAEELVSLAVQQGAFVVVHDKSYNPFVGRSEDEQRDWLLFGSLLGGGLAFAFEHVEWLLGRPFQNVEEWLGPEGDKYRAAWFFKPLPDKFRKRWAKFRAKHADKTLADLNAEIERIRSSEEYRTAVRRHEVGL